MTLPAILTAAMDQGGAGHGINDRGRSIEVMAFQTADVCERRVVRNSTFTQRVNWLR